MALKTYFNAIEENLEHLDILNIFDEMIDKKELLIEHIMRNIQIEASEYTGIRIRFKHYKMDYWVNHCGKCYITFPSSFIKPALIMMIKMYFIDNYRNNSNEINDLTYHIKNTPGIKHITYIDQHFKQKRIIEKSKDFMSYVFEELKFTQEEIFLLK